MNLSELIDAHRAGRSYPELERDCGGRPSAKRLQQLARSPIKNFPDPPTVRALARGLKVSQSVVVLAAAESLGLDVRRPSSRLVELLPADARNLTELQAAAVAHLVSTIVDPGESGGADTFPDNSPGPEPDLRDVLLASFLGRRFDGDVAAALEAATAEGEPEWLVEELRRRLGGGGATVAEYQEAARKGTPHLRAVRRQQDEAGEAPDPEGPEGGA